MPDPKTYWAVIDDRPTECIIDDNLYGGVVLVHLVDKPDRIVSISGGFVHADKASCIHHVLETLARYYSDGERDIRNRMMQQAQLFNKMQALQKELEECDAGK